MVIRGITLWAFACMIVVVHYNTSYAFLLKRRILETVANIKGLSQTLLGLRVVVLGIPE